MRPKANVTVYLSGSMPDTTYTIVKHGSSRKLERRSHPRMYHQVLRTLSSHISRKGSNDSMSDRRVLFLAIQILAHHIQRYEEGWGVDPAVPQRSESRPYKPMVRKFPK